MPELPEVEHIRRRLSDRIIGLEIVRVLVKRSDVIRIPVAARNRSRSLLRNGRIKTLHRHGKRLALEVRDGRVLEFGLGMSGGFLLEPVPSTPAASTHRHVIWSLQEPRGGRPMRLVWRDPRRFGGLRPVSSLEELQARFWSQIGPDALQIDVKTLLMSFSVTKRVIKTVLLDQQVLAGVGNIYADEALHAAGLLPTRAASSLDQTEAEALLKSLRQILHEAIEVGGSTIRDHQDPEGQPGGFQARHAVYGRPGASCKRCGEQIQSEQLGGRTSHWCPGCQK
jgi:formamidopyrimidine-DNA glycosylase